MSVSAWTSEMRTAEASVIESARKNCPITPESMPERHEDDDRRQRRADDRRDQLLHRELDGLARCFPLVEMPVDVLDHDDGVVDDQPDGDREAAHRHDVDRFAEPPHDQEGGHDGEGQRDRGDQRQPPVAQEDEQHDHREDAADEDRVADVGDRGGHELREVVGLGELQAGRQGFGEIGERRFDARRGRRGCSRRPAATR